MFNILGKVDIALTLLEFFKTNWAKRSEFSFRILVGISVSWDAFLAFIFFSCCSMSVKVAKLKVIFLLSTILSIPFILARYSQRFKAYTTISLKRSTFCFSKLLLTFKFRLLTTFEKNSLGNLTIFSSSEIISSLFIKVNWSESRVLSVKKAFTACQTILLSVIFCIQVSKLFFFFLKSFTN